MNIRQAQLPQGWKIKKLGEVCDFQNGFAFQSKSYKESGLPILRITNIQNDEIDTKELVYFDTKDYKVNLDRFKVYQGDLLIAMSGATTGKLGINKSETVFYLNQRVGKFIPKKYLNKAFLYYFLTTKVDESLRIAAGAAQPNLNTKQINNFEIPLPPLPEQQRIVSILDEAFAAIAKAKANADQNLKNAKELFESYLQGVFENKGEGWEEQLFENCFKLKSGVNLTAKNMTEGEYPVFGGNGIAGYHNEYNLSGSNVIIGRVGALCGNVRHINENIWLTDNAFKVVDFKFDFDHSFLTYLLNHKDLRSYARQAAQPVISNSSLKDVVLFFPKSKTEQQTIVRQLDALRAETQKLEAVYQQKIDDLEELKKSILQKAFAGELKTEKAVAV